MTSSLVATEDSKIDRAVATDRPSPRGVDEKNRSLQVLFLSADTGGGHRASAESLAVQFQRLYPGTDYHLLNVLADLTPYKDMCEQYKHLSSHPNQWKAFYHITNIPTVHHLTNVTMRLSGERTIREKIAAHEPDVVVSVHPLMNHVPLACCRRISKETGRPLPFFTVVTDLGSGHCQWFASGVEKLFVASDRIRNLARDRGGVSEDKFVEVGLPIRHDFAVSAERLGDRSSTVGKAYRTSVRRDVLAMPDPHADADEAWAVLVMGGGEGVGSLSTLVDALYGELDSRGATATVFVVCGRNQTLKDALDHREWDEVSQRYAIEKMLREEAAQSLLEMNCLSVTNGSTKPTNTNTGCIVANTSTGCMNGSVSSRIKKVLSGHSASAMAVPTDELRREDDDNEDNGSGDYGDSYESQEEKKDISPSTTYEPTFSIPGNDHVLEDEEHSPPPSTTTTDRRVRVVGLGFVDNMADYMIAADVLVTKAGPGTIAEAASLSLPIMLTSFLPGQEEGNVDFVVENDFGRYVPDDEPHRVAAEVCDWLENDEELERLSRNAGTHGKPHAAEDIVRFIGDSTIEWRRKARESGGDGEGGAEE